MKAILTLSALLTFSANTLAGEFATWSFADEDLDATAIIADDVTNDFTKEFPSAKYLIVIIGNNSSAGDHQICYALAGVTYRPKSAEYPQMPKFRTSATRAKLGPPLTIGEKRDCLQGAIRIAVKNLMSVPMKELRSKSGLK